MRQIRRPFAVVAVLAVFLAACAGSDDSQPDASQPTADNESAETEAADETPEAPAESDADESPEVTAEAIGTVTVDGIDYGISETLLCEPYADDVIDVELELQGIGTAPDGTRIQIDVYVQELAGMPFDDVSWAGPEGVYGGPEDAQVTVSGNQATGSATLQHAMGDGTTLFVEFDLPIPSSTFACR